MVDQLARESSMQPLLLRRKLQQLGPRFVIRGQFLALRPDQIGVANSAELLGLRDQWEQLSPGEVKVIVEHQLGTSVDDVFASFDWLAFESRLVSQSHRAELWDGSRVEVKVRRPDGQRSVYGTRSEERAFWKLLRVATNDADIEEALESPIGEWLEQSASFSTELRNLVRLRDLSEADDPAHIPKPYAELCTEELLITELADGVPILDVAPLRVGGEPHSTSNGPHALAAAQNLYLATLSQVLVNGFAVANLHPDNVWLLPDSRITYRSTAYCFDVLGMSGREEVRFLAAAHRASLDDVVDASRRLVLTGDVVDFAAAVRAFTTDARARVFPLVDSALRTDKVSVDAPAVFLGLITAADQSGLRFPRNVDLAQKLLVSAGSAARRISTAVDFRTASNYLAALMRDDDLQDLDPDRVEQNLLRLMSLVSAAPGHFERLLSELGDGSLNIGISSQESEKNRVDHNRRTRLLAMSILTVGVTGLAVASPSSSILASMPTNVFVVVLSAMYLIVFAFWWRMR